MKMRVMGLMILLAVFVSAGARFSTQVQSYVASALDDLKFERQEEPEGKTGGEPRFKVTADTIKHLQGLMKKGSTITVDSDGVVSVE